MLTPEQRAKFLEAVNNPESELARSLLASEQAAIRPPWWEAAASNGVGDAVTNDSEATTSSEGGSSGRPSPMHIPTRMIKPLPVGQVSLVYNFVAIW